MSTALVPEGLEPLGVWDANIPEYRRGPWRERAEWLGKHIGSPDFITRAAFYLLDAPFAVVDRFVVNSDGLKHAEDGEPVTETVFAPLAGLPPAHLLGHP